MKSNSPRITSGQIAWTTDCAAALVKALTDESQHVATVNILDSRAKSRMDIGLHIGIILKLPTEVDL